MKPSPCLQFGLERKRPRLQLALSKRVCNRDGCAPVALSGIVWYRAIALIVVACLISLLTQAVFPSSINPYPVGSVSQIDRVEHVDLLILHGTLVDGSANKPRKADVGIRGDRIVFV